MERDIPTTIVAITVSAYWFAVLLMVARSWIRFRSAAGVVPKLAWERWMWLIWIPNIIAWMVLSWQPSSRPAAFHELPLAVAVRYAAALMSIAALVLTSHCWFVMGSNWSMAVTPKKSTSLIRTGAFGVVRHPIYALSLLLMLATVITVANWSILLVGGIHAVMIVAKTISEERYLRQVHGIAYEQYCQISGRYLPSLRGLLQCFGR